MAARPLVRKLEQLKRLKRNSEARTAEAIVRKTTWLGFHSAQVFARRRGASSADAAQNDEKAPKTRKNAENQELALTHSVPAPTQARPTALSQQQEPPKPPDSGQNPEGPQNPL